MKVLLTGFESNNDGLNASEILVKSFQDNLPPKLSIHIDNLEFKIMPENTNILGRIVNETLELSSLDICILTGQARGYNKICFERMTKNLKYFVTLDKAGNAPKGEEIVPSAPVAYWNCRLSSTCSDKHGLLK
jgi:pyroglutamyl-peptidase